MRRIVTNAAVVLFAGVVLAGCGGDDDNGAASDATPTSRDTSAPVGDKLGATVTLVAKNFEFDKEALTATAGQPVSFVLDNQDTAKHNLTINGLDVDEDVEGGESGSKTVESPTAGSYEYLCEYHPATMKGTLTVS